MKAWLRWTKLQLVYCRNLEFIQRSDYSNSSLSVSDIMFLNQAKLWPPPALTPIHVRRTRLYIKNLIRLGKEKFSSSSVPHMPCSFHPHVWTPLSEEINKRWYTYYNFLIACGKWFNFAIDWQNNKTNLPTIARLCSDPAAIWMGGRDPAAIWKGRRSKCTTSGLNEYLKASSSTLIFRPSCP